jgi:CheY-like chemotaxis protein
MPRVLVVEDDALVREMVVEALRDAGFEVMEAEDGGTALAVCGSAALDVLLTDIRLPGPISGWDVAEKCRERHPTLPVIYATAVSIVPPRPVPGSRWCNKPYTPEQIVACVKAATPARAAG